MVKTCLDLALRHAEPEAFCPDWPASSYSLSQLEYIDCSKYGCSSPTKWATDGFVAHTYIPVLTDTYRRRNVDKRPDKKFLLQRITLDHCNQYCVDLKIGHLVKETIVTHWFEGLLKFKEICSSLMPLIILQKQSVTNQLLPQWYLY